MPSRTRDPCASAPVCPSATGVVAQCSNNLLQAQAEARLHITTKPTTQMAAAIKQLKQAFRRPSCFLMG